MSKRFIVGFILPILLTGMCMWVLDPFHIFSIINSTKKPFNPRERASLALAITRMEPEAVFIGTSRARRLDPLHPGWEKKAVLNGGLSGARMFEVADYIEHLHSTRPLTTALIEVSFWKMPIETRPTDTTNIERLRLADNQDAIGYVRYMLRKIIDRYQGLFSLKDFLIAQKYKGTLATDIFPPTLVRLFKDFPAAPKHTPPASTQTYEDVPTPIIDSLQRIIRLGELHNTDMRFFLSPLHMNNLYFVPDKDWSLYEEQLRQITTYLDGGNEFGNHYPLWSFQRFNNITLVQPPPLKPGDSIWYDNREHFSAKTGTMMLDTIFATCNEPCQTPPDNFAILLTLDTIEQHIEHLRAYRDLPGLGSQPD